MLSPTPWYINAMYDRCKWQRLETVRVEVEVEPGRKHELHRLRIKELRHFIARMLQLTRKDLHRSHNPKGMPWRAAHTWADGTEFQGDYIAERVMALGAAAGFVTIIPRRIEGLDDAVQHFVVVEDQLIENWLAAEERDKRIERRKKYTSHTKNV